MNNFVALFLYCSALLRINIVSVSMVYITMYTNHEKFNSRKVIYFQLSRASEGHIHSRASL